MALEFDCPYCKAIIRVPDNAAGKRGRCPQCATRVSVPKLGQMRHAGEQPAFFPGPPEPEAVAVLQPPDDDEVVFQEFDPQTEAIDPAVEASLLPGDIAIPELGSTGPRSLPQPVRHMPDTLLSRSKRRKSSAGLWISVVAVGLLAGGAAVGWYWYQAESTLEGELTAELIENPRLPPGTIPRDVITLPPDDTEKILSKLEHSPQPLVSNLGLSDVTIGANTHGLRISVAPGSATSLYRVDIAGHPKLAAYRQKHAAVFDEARDENLALAVNQYFRALKDASGKKEARLEMGQFRDSVCYAACVKGFGAALQAIHQRQPFLCVFEDREAVYFLLPAGVQRFDLQGRPAKRGQPRFEGKFEVKVNGTRRMPGGSADEPEPKDVKPSEKKSDDGEMKDEPSRE